MTQEQNLTNSKRHAPTSRVYNVNFHPQFIGYDWWDIQISSSPPTRNLPFCTSKVAEREICAWPFLCLWWTWDLPKHTHKFLLYIWMKTVIVIFLSNTVLHDLSAHQPPKTSYFVAMWLNEKSVHGHFFVSDGLEIY